MRPVGSKNVKWDKVELQRLYWGERMSCHAIAKQYGTVFQAVLKALQRFGIPRRSHSEAASGELHYKWKGDSLRYTDSNGYIFVRAPEGHPYADKSGYIREHRLVMEKKVGHYLPPSVIVHHLNGIYDDNRDENLIAFDKKTHDNLLPALQKRIRELEHELARKNRQMVMGLRT